MILKILDLLLLFVVVICIGAGLFVCAGDMNRAAQAGVRFQSMAQIPSGPSPGPGSLLLAANANCWGAYIIDATQGNLNQCETSIGTRDMTIQGSVVSSTELPAGTPSTYLSADFTAGTVYLERAAGDFAGWDQMSVMCWARREDNSDNQYPMGENSSFRIRFRLAANAWQGRFGGNQGSAGAISPAVGEWHHYAMTWGSGASGGNNWQRYYTDGVYGCQNADPNGCSTFGGTLGGTDPFRIGDLGFSGNNPLNGYAHECVVWNDILSDEQICFAARCGANDSVPDRGLPCNMGALTCAN